jgi:hypothetical protein
MDNWSLPAPAPTALYSREDFYPPRTISGFRYPVIVRQRPSAEPEFVQIVAPQRDNQIHNERLLPADEQWSSRREQLASSGRCTTVTI